MYSKYLKNSNYFDFNIDKWSRVVYFKLIMEILNIRNLLGNGLC